MINDLENISFEELCEMYNKYFSLGYLGTDGSNKLACIALVCNITNALKKKGKILNCYEVLLSICKDYTSFQKNTFLKGIGAICQDFLYFSDTFPDFGLEPKQMPKKVREILDEYLPF